MEQGGMEHGAWSMERGVESVERATGNGGWLGKLVALASLPMRMQNPSAGSRCHYSPAQIKPQASEVAVSASTALFVHHAPPHQEVALSVVELINGDVS